MASPEATQLAYDGAVLALTCALVLSASCKDACLRHVTDPAMRARVCGRCFTDANRADWTAALSDAPLPVVESLLTDPDWAVRWGGVRALAKRKSQTHE